MPFNLRDEFQLRIDSKRRELRDLENRIQALRSFIDGLEYAASLLPSDSAYPDSDSQLRKGTTVARAQAIIKAANRPLHVSEILRLIGEPDDNTHRVSLSGSLAAYVRKGQVFTRPAPNTFGLIEIRNRPKEAEDFVSEQEPEPDDPVPH